MHLTEQQHRELTDLRRSLHRIPELGFQEVMTSDAICAQLDALGVSYERGLAETGIVATLKAGGGNRAIGLRADIDALPITETADRPHRSRHDGVMHACGHDGHTTMLLGALQVIKARMDFDGIVHFIFQPAEEHGQGALRMIADGLFERFPCETVFGLHNMPTQDFGTFAVRPGPIMAAEDNFVIRVRGQGGHAAFPHKVKDALTVGAAIVTELQTIVSRGVSPLESAVVSCTEFLTDGAVNVIPGEVTIKGDVRSFRPEVSAFVEQRMREIAAGLTAAHGMGHEVDYTRVFLPTINTAAEAALAAEVARSVAGAEAVDDACAPLMGSEDFGAMLRERPGAYILLGTRSHDGAGDAMLHNPAYDFNDAVIPQGVSYWVRLVERVLPASAAA